MNESNSGLRTIREAVYRVLNLGADDLWAVDYLVCLSVINTWSEDPEPVWGFLCGPPGSAKTELLRMLEGWRYAVFVDELTENSLASGHKDPDSDEDPSLLPQLNGKLLVARDFSTHSSQTEQTLAKILGQLRAAYDGTYSKWSGSAGKREYRCKFGFIAATVPEIDRFISKHQKLGERFIFLRLHREASVAYHRRLRQISHVMRMMKNKAHWRSDLRSITHLNLDRIRESCRNIRPSDIRMSDPQAELLWNLSDVVSRLRTRPGDDHPVEPEVASRLVQQFANMAYARAASESRLYLNQSDEQFVARLAVDSLPTDIRRMIMTLWFFQDLPISRNQLKESSGLPLSTIARQVDQWLFISILREENKKIVLHPDTVSEILKGALLPPPGAKEQATLFQELPPETPEDLGMVTAD